MRKGYRRKVFHLSKNYLGEYYGKNEKGVEIHVFPFRDEQNLPINSMWNYRIYFGKGSGLNRLTHDRFPSIKHALHDLNNYINYWWDEKIKFNLVERSR